jgi:hypothetical protein
MLRHRAAYQGRGAAHRSQHRQAAGAADQRPPPQIKTGQNSRPANGEDSTPAQTVAEKGCHPGAGRTHWSTPAWRLRPDFRLPNGGLTGVGKSWIACAMRCAFLGRRRPTTAPDARACSSCERQGPSTSHCRDQPHHPSVRPEPRRLCCGQDQKFQDASGVAVLRLVLKTPRDTHKRHSLAELLKGARGVVNSGIADLASNPDHLKGFGRGAQRHR